MAGYDSGLTKAVRWHSHAIEELSGVIVSLMKASRGHENGRKGLPGVEGGLTNDCGNKAGVTKTF